ncbi:RNA 2',3'-cyclic phosphodiesterase [Solirubrobacter phytolaccae]|uniref:RNA 2',3'-cyclic phosphodiesterase n=1 Tax=Solirubrobacter phytolaccae TaxID=1404360 RepID=A0A9X3N9B6_9ACTN|nr:RNA 2',3'-cyclic phosphodiesterase [Solirubrobacter phytolaccae]MDA0182168.1 RNA 2',3'-cyclic phosphodiesterase [Solirubrobacter phytolaccae]
MRLFVALDLPEDVRDALTAAGQAADPEVWRPVKPESLHITLAFLGERPEEDVEAIAPVVLAESVAPRLELGDVLLLPPRRARVLTVEIHGPLGDLQARVSAGLEAAGVYTPETRPFRAHVTIARLRPRVRPPREAPLALAPIAFAGPSVTLYVSRLHQHGATYQPLVKAPLAQRVA